MATLQMRVDDDLKKKSDDLFQSLGMDTSTAIRIFLTFAIEHNGIPFDVRHAPEDLSLEKAIEIPVVAKIFMALMPRLQMLLPPCWRSSLCTRLSTLAA